MSRVMIVCPVTDRLVPTGHESELVSGFRRAVPQSGTLACDACGRAHNWSRPETVLDGARPGRRRARMRDAVSQPGIRYVLRPVDHR